jgi:hypothetical protein
VFAHLQEDCAQVPQNGYNSRIQSIVAQIPIKAEGIDDVAPGPSVNGTDTNEPLGPPSGTLHMEDGGAEPDELRTVQQSDFKSLTAQTQSMLPALHIAIATSSLILCEYLTHDC